MAIKKLSDSVVLEHSSGASAKILYYGATLISWTLASGAENLFLSRYTSLENSPTTVLQNWMDQRLFVAGFHWCALLESD
jgi:hypothetical protein